MWKTILMLNVMIKLSNAFEKKLLITVDVIWIENLEMLQNCLMDEKLWGQKIWE